MTILDRRNAFEPHETILSMERAAEQRFLEGISLLHEFPTRGVGGVYLMGYVTECLLKAAYGRIKNLPLSQRLFPELKATGLNLHDFELLLDLCLRSRRTKLAPAQEAEFLRHVKIIRDNHGGNMRYLSFKLDISEVDGLYESTDWIRKNYNSLWR